jgi:hypothetical protein
MCIRDSNKAAAMKADPITSMVGVPYEKLGGPEILEGIHSTREGMKDLAKQGSTAVGTAVSRAGDTISKVPALNPDQWPLMPSDRTIAIAQDLGMSGVNKVGEGIEALKEMWDKGSWENKPYRKANERKHSDPRYRELLEEALPNLTKEQLDAKFNNQTGPMPPSTIDQLKGWLGGSSDKTKKAKETGKTKETDKAGKGDKAKKGGSSSAELQGLLDQLPFKADKTGKMTKETALALMAAGAKMMASKRPDFLGTVGEGLGGFTTQANLQNKLATDRMVAEGKLATAGSTGLGSLRGDQIKLANKLADIKKDMAAQLKAGHGGRAKELQNTLNQFAANIYAMSGTTGLFTDLHALRTADIAHMEGVETGDGEGIFGSAIADVKELVSQ